MWQRRLTYFCWAMLTWTLLTWTATFEQVFVGVGLSVAISFACAPLGPLARPWVAAVPRRFAAVCRVAAVVTLRVFVANLRLARLIWSPRPRPSSGMVIVDTSMRSDGGLAAVGVLTSVVVDSQLVDLDRERNELQYHAVWAAADGDENRRHINEPIERRLQGVTR